MAGVLVDHVKGCSDRRRKRRRSSGSEGGWGDVPGWFTVEGVLEGVRVLRVRDETCLMATVLSLEELVVGLWEEGKGQRVKLVVVDSIAFHFRVSY